MDRPHEPLRPVLSRSKRDRELEAGARAHFEDAAYYTQTYADRTDDVAYYARLAARHEHVLEHGIGNGRVAIPIARAGTRVTGIDRSREMLADLRERLRSEPADVRRRVVAKRGDVRTAKVAGKRFPLVLCPFNTALHLYARRDVEAWLANVRRQLAPRGTLVFDVSMPMLEDLVRKPDAPYRTAPFDYPGVGKVSYREYFDYDRVRQILFVSMVFEPAPGGRAGADESFMTPLAHRQFFPQELEALLHYNGFEATAVHGDWDGSPLANDSEVMIWHARVRR